MTTPLVHGTCDPRLTPLKHLLSHNLRSGRDLGASICVSHHGTNLADIWGGHTDPFHTTPWTQNTITNIWSTSKLITALAALLCIDRGLLDPEERVCTYWPEFATNGKQDVKVWHILSHASGLSTWAEDVDIYDIMDVAKTTTMLEQQAPLWEPGTRSGYHGLTMGHLVGELVRRVTSKTLGQFVADELAGPLGADFQFGAKEEDWHRCAEIVPPPQMDVNAPVPEEMRDPQSLVFRSFMNPILEPKVANTEAWRRAEVGAGNGFSNARGVVQILSPLALGGTVDGKRILSAETIDLIFETRISGSNVDLVIGKPVRFGLGFGIVDKDTWVDWAPEGRVLTWGGLGGSVAVVDLGRGLTISYVMNRMEDNVGDGEVDEEGRAKRDRFREYVAAVYEGLGIAV